MWISVKDRLPEKRMAVLVYYREFTAFFYKPFRQGVTEYLGNKEFSGGVMGDVHITHWQPLPAPPQE